MEVGRSAALAPALTNGTGTPTPEENEVLYTRLLQLRDLVVQGKHPQFTLPSAAVQLLQDGPGTLNGSEEPARAVTLGATSSLPTDRSQHASQSTVDLPRNGLPGLQASSASFTGETAPAFSRQAGLQPGLDPIFLAKPDSLVRAEGQLRRQRLERDLQAQGDQRKQSSRDKDQGPDALSALDVDDVLRVALERAQVVSGLQTTAKAVSVASSSFDENDYYSSQVHSDWSSDVHSSKGSDKVTGAFTADFERLDTRGPSRPGMHGKLQPPDTPECSPKTRQDAYNNDLDDAYEPDDEDDEYTPPGAAAIDSSRQDIPMVGVQQATSADDGDDSDYEPGELAQESSHASPYQAGPNASLVPPKVPVIRNQLTHIAAPQPNRVSPLATAKGPSIELELVNGRPEIVQKPQAQGNPVHSRASTASPSGAGVGSLGRKKRTKKRKRDNEASGRAKRRRERQGGHQTQAQHETQVKNEPVSPPPFAPEPPQYLSSSNNVYDSHPPPHVQNLRSGYERLGSPAVIRVASSAAHRPLQGDAQETRRVTSLHNVHQPQSPRQLAFSPVAPYRAISMTYGDQRMTQPHAYSGQEASGQYIQRPDQVDTSVQYVRSRHAQSPPRLREYVQSFPEAVQSSLHMPPPRKVVVDQYGNEYFAAELAPAPAPISRASVAPLDRNPPQEVMYERGPSRISYKPVPPPQNHGYVDNSMAPPPPPHRTQPTPSRGVEYIDASGRRIREYSARPIEAASHSDMRTSPVYQPDQSYSRITVAPPAATPQSTSPVYQQMPRSYSVRPEDPPRGFMRQQSAAPPTYIRQEPPPPPPSQVGPQTYSRAMSVMPGNEYGAPSMRTYSQAPQNALYVDQYGNEVFPSQVRQVFQ